MIIISLVISIITYVISYKIIHIISSAIILSIASFFIPYLILKFLIKNNKNKILDMFPNYIISLKNYTKSSNDILIAMRKVKCDDSIYVHISKFNVLVEKGVSVYEAFEILKKDVDIERVNVFFTAIEHAFLNGGDVNDILDKYARILLKTNLQIEKEKQESFSTKLVLFILLFINVYLLFGFVLTDVEYRNIMVNTITGNIIVNLNIISYFLIFYFYEKLNKMEE